MIHSLGNTLASSAIQDWGLPHDKYRVLNAAVPSEVYYPPAETSIRLSQLVHYSTGDEVLELLDDNDLSVFDGITSLYKQYSWHHQEQWKGRSVIDGLGGTTWAGWNIEENAFGMNKISETTAAEMDIIDPSMFKTNTVFCLNPPSVNATNIALLVRGAILTQGIPALARPTGATNLTWRIFGSDNFDLNADSSGTESPENANNLPRGIPRPNGWPTRSRWDDRWLHSDMKDVSYFYNFMFYFKVKEKGGLQ